MSTPPKEIPTPRGREEVNESVVRYEEREAVAFVTINRPEKKNTLTEAVIQGIADGIDRANSSREARAVVLRGAGGVFSAGYDLTGGYDWRDETGWQKTFDAPGPNPGPGPGIRCGTSPSWAATWPGS